MRDSDEKDEIEAPPGGPADSDREKVEEPLTLTFKDQALTFRGQTLLFGNGRISLGDDNGN